MNISFLKSYNQNNKNNYFLVISGLFIIVLSNATKLLIGKILSIIGILLLSLALYNILSSNFKLINYVGDNNTSRNIKEYNNCIYITFILSFVLLISILYYAFLIFN